MDDLVDSLVDIKEDHSEDYTATRVDLDVDVQSSQKEDGRSVFYEITAPEEVVVYFALELEYRSWGIKDISVKITKDIDFEVIITPEGADEGVEKVIHITPDDIKKITWIAGKAFTPSDIVIDLDSEGKILEVELIMYYLVPD